MPIDSEKVQAPVDFAINKSSAEPYVNCGLFNKRNTCYIDASLQCLSTIEQFCKNYVIVETFQIFFGSISIFAVLQGFAIKSGKPNFSLFQQQNAVESFSCIFEEFCVESLHAQHKLFKLRNEITYNTCFNDSSNEESSSLAMSCVKFDPNSFKFVPTGRNLVWR